MQLLWPNNKLSSQIDLDFIENIINAHQYLPCKLVKTLLGLVCMLSQMDPNKRVNLQEATCTAMR